MLTKALSFAERLCKSSVSDTSDPPSTPQKRGGLTKETKSRMSKLSAQVRAGRMIDPDGDIGVAIHR